MKYLLILAFLSVLNPDPQCIATTKSGEQCSRKAQEGAKYCWQHNPSIPTCGAATKSGSSCTRKVAKAGEKCWQHQ